MTLETTQQNEIIKDFFDKGFNNVKQVKEYIEVQEYTDTVPGAKSRDNTINTLIEYFQQKNIEQKKKKQNKVKKELEKKLFTGFGAEGHKTRLDQGRYVLSCVQNNTELDRSMWESLQRYCKRNKAKLLLAKMPYNKNGFLQPIDSDDLWYAPETTPYLVEGHIKLGEKFEFIANASVIPTAKNPINGFESATNAGVHTIVPASKIALKVVPAPFGAATKTLMSTGTITKRNYIMRKAGTVAATEHNIGAIFIDTETGEYRHLEQMPGCQGFYDMHRLYTGTGTRQADNSIIAWQPGDIHAEKMGTKEGNSLRNTLHHLKPKNIILHDLLDFESRNHHNIKNPFFMIEQSYQQNTVLEDLQSAALVLEDLSAEDNNLIVIQSNHDLAIERWVKETDYRTDPVNAKIYLELALAKVNAIENHEYNFSMLKYWINKNCDDLHNLKFNPIGEPLKIAGVEMSNHGHQGINGAIGNPQSFRKFGIPMNTGHTHSPSITGKCYTAGVSAGLDLGYNVGGGSSWAIADIITYRNGQRQIYFREV